MCGRSFLISLNSYLFRTYQYTDKTPQKAEEQLIMMMEKPKKHSFKDTQVSISVFSADISISKDISRWWRTKRLCTAITTQKRFFLKIHTYLLLKMMRPFHHCVQIVYKSSNFWNQVGQTDKHTYTQTHRHTGRLLKPSAYALGLIMEYNHFLLMFDETTDCKVLNS